MGGRVNILSLGVSFLLCYSPGCMVPIRLTGEFHCTPGGPVIIVKSRLII